jgi:DNA-binding transcriptional regulator LsrR (DeoR family)
MTEQDPDYALLTEIAVAYYDQEQTQEEIAQRFGISRIKVGRLLKKARQEGIVEISVKYHPVFSSQIEQQFISHFGIKRALIALDHHDEDEQRQQVAALVSNYLAGILKNDMTVTVGQGAMWLPSPTTLGSSRSGTAVLSVESAEPNATTSS